MKLVTYACLIKMCFNRIGLEIQVILARNLSKYIWNTKLKNLNNILLNVEIE